MTTEFMMMSPICGKRLRTEYLPDPLGIDVQSPRFFWWVEDRRPGARQTACRIRCASSRELLAQDRPDLWDSGKVEDGRQAHVEYGGAALTSRQQVWWDVQLWDADGVAGIASEPARFEMGLLWVADWSARWIQAPLAGTGSFRPPVPLMRKTFLAAGDVKQARLYVSALGLYVASINGERVSDDWFRPGWTDYAKRVQYQAYDVTALISEGGNALGVMLGDGWYCGRIAHMDRGMLYGTCSALLAQLELAYADGRCERIVTDASWQWTTGPILGSDMLDGEDYDARREIVGWDRPGSVAGDWKAVELATPENVGPLVASAALPVRCVEELQPVTEPRTLGLGWGRKGCIFDLGQNMSGVVRLRVRGPAGATVRLRYAEMLQANGHLYTENLRSARATDYYTLRGDPAGESWTPCFTFHGFRYVELSAADAWFSGETPLVLDRRDAVTGLALMSQTPETGEFHCDHDLLNKLHSNIRWGQRGNFLEVPTDCPQRDERLGWTGDAQVFAPTAAFNTDVAPFFTKWSVDLDDAQLDDGGTPHVVPDALGSRDSGPGWSDARIIIPWTLYNAYGDQRGLQKHYPGIRRWLEYLNATSRDGLRCGPWHEGHRGFGDWLALDVEGNSATSKELIGTAYFAYAAGIGTKIATVLGFGEDARRFAAMRQAAVGGFNRTFVSPAGLLTEPTQTAYLMALAWDLLPEAIRPVAFERLLELFRAKNWHLSTGFLGTPLICPVLTRFGRTDIAYRILLQTTYPGWLCPVVNGATTMWERWNSWTPEDGFGDAGMNSYNHYAYGAIGEWMYRTIAGLDCGQPGYRHIRIAPQPGGSLRRAGGALDSIHGRIEAAWAIVDGVFTLEARVPANTTAEIVLPDGTTHRVAAGEHRYSIAWNAEAQAAAVAV